ncbi:TlpA family protein disulfide reductase [Nonomuraea sp. PA05]|uniref:TlpA family protein disulfide reductase n=1 Tax=Nonomuraea sp. PA05 TaxID=2604466 RepID=UPI001651C199|nr:TlpA disulfide reductase family protein [Nonomuraea sp. PA05]
MRRLVAVLAVVSALSVVLVHTLGGRPGEVHPEHRPVLFGRTVDGRPFDPASLWGRPVVVTVWASWCDPCRHELATLAGLSRTLHGVRFVGVNLRDRRAAARSFLAESGATAYPHLSDADGGLASELGARRVPETFLLDARGLVAARTTDAVTRGWVEEHVQP